MNKGTERPRKGILLKSFWVCLIFMALYVIGFYTLPLPGNNELNYIIFSPIVFVLSWVFFYVFILLKGGSQLKYFLLGCLLLACFFIYVNGIFNVDIRLENAFNFSKLPKEYEKYVDINNSKNTFGKHEIDLFIASDNPVYQLLTQNNELIIHSTTSPQHTNDPFPTIHDFCKLDKNGNQIDHYSFRQDSDDDKEVLFEGYLINVSKNYFRNWPLRGDTIRKTIEIFNEDLKWSRDQQRQKLTEIEKEATYLMSTPVYHSDRNNEYAGSYYKITYLINDKWYTFYENFSDEEYFPYKIEPKGNLVNDLFGQWEEDQLEPSDNAPPPNIRSVYYQKVQRMRDRHDAKTGEYDRGDAWQGYLFSQLIVDNDTLKFKDKLYLDEEWHWSKIEINNKNIGALSFENTEQFKVYSFYSNPALNYQLFTNQRNRLYLIKKIK
ncbi:hypothetical protein [Sphingobacterium ginsenosidimutans]